MIRHGWLIQLEVLFERFFDLFDFEGGDGADVFHAQSLDQRLQLDLNGLLTLKSTPGAGVFLVTGHAGDTVIHDDGDDRTVVIDDIQQGRDAGVEEGRNLR